MTRRRYTIADVGRFFVRPSALPALGRIIAVVKRIFCFETERHNRLKRALEIQKAYAAGVPVGTIIKEYRCSKGTVLRYARAANLAKRSKRAYSEGTRTAALAMWQDGRPIAEISARLGVSAAWVSLLAKDAKLSRHSAPRRQHHNP